MSIAPVSVIIPTYNRPQLVCDAIDSVLAQTVRPVEIVVVEDGSAENNGAALGRAYGDAIRYHYKTNGGLPAARNTGIRLSTHPLIAFLDDDDVWHPRKIELQTECFERDPELGLLGTEQFDWPAEAFPAAPEADAAKVFYDVSWDALVVRTLIPVSSVVLRREVLGRSGLFDETFKSSEDREFFLRVARVAKVGMVNAPLSGYRDTPGSMCKNPAGREEQMRRILTEIDRTNGWGGRRLLRRKAYSYMHHACSDVNARAGNHVGAVARTLKSLAYYPLPYRSDETRLRFDRPRRLAVNVLRMLRLKSPDRIGAARALPTTTALDALRARASRGTQSGHGQAMSI